MPEATFDARPGTDGSTPVDAQEAPDAATDSHNDVSPDRAQDVSADQSTDVTAEDAQDVSSDQALPDGPDDVSAEDGPTSDTSQPDAPPDAEPDAAPDAPPDVQADGPCLPPLAVCSGQCVDNKTSTQHCGSCGNKCPTPINAIATCAAGVCSFDCAGGFANCNSQSADGCETAFTKTYREEVLADTPLAYWRLGDSAGSTVADSSGHSLTLTVNAPVTFSQTGALYCDADKSMKFSNAGGGWLGHTKTSALEPTAAISLELWMQQTGAPSDYEKPLWYGDASVLPWGSWGLQRDATSPGKFAFLVATNGITNWLTTLAIKQKDLWYHVVATYDGTAQRIYVNGVLDVQDPAEGPISYPPDNFGVAVGACYGPCSVFSGTIDEVAIYDKALSAARIAAHYAAALP